MSDSAGGGRSGGIKKRVALFRKNFLPYTQTFIHDEIRHHERYEVTVFARKWRNMDRFPGHDVVWLEKHPGQTRRIESLWYRLWQRSSRFDSVFRQRRFDIVHAHFGYDGIYAVPFAQRHSLPLVVSLHGHDVSILMSRERYRPKYWHYCLTRGRLFRSVDMFLPVSTELKNMLVSLGCPADKITVHPLGIDLRKFKPAPVPKGGRPLVAMIGRLVEKKGFKYGIQAFLEVARKGIDAELVVIGDGALLGELRALVNNSNSVATVSFAGSLSHDETAEILKSASVLLVPSVVAANLDREGGPIVAKEAAACGVPVVGTLHGGLPDIVDDGETGYLVPERDAGALAERLAVLLANEELRADFGRKSRLKMERQFGVRSVSSRLEEIYDSVVDARISDLNDQCIRMV